MAAKFNGARTESSLHICHRPKFSANIAHFCRIFQSSLHMKILKDSAVYLLGELFAKALPFLLLPYLTRKLGAAGFGELSYYQTVLSLLALAFGLSQDGAITRYFYFYGKRNLPNVLRTGGLYTLALTLFGLLFAWWRQSWILGFVVLTAGSQTLLGTQLAWRQCQKRALSYVAIQISSSALSAVLTVLLLECTAYQPVAMRFAALCSVNFAVAAAAYCWANQKQPAHFTRRRALHSLRYILAFGLPLLLHHASGFVKGQLDRIIIYRMYSAAELGVYAAALQLAGILSIILMAVNKATVPYYYHAIEQKKITARRVRRWAWLGLCAAPLFAAAVWCMPESWFVWFLGPQYIGAHHYIVLFTLGYALTIPYYLLVNYLFYFGKNSLISSISLLSAAIYLLILFAVAQLGMAWLPWAMVAGNLAILPILYYFVRPNAAD